MLMLMEGTVGTSRSLSPPSRATNRRALPLLAAVLCRDCGMSPAASQTWMNPSLTITAQAERAFSFWPNKSESDPRPTQDEPYVKLSGVSPKLPVVPVGAFSSLYK